MMGSLNAKPGKNEVAVNTLSVTGSLPNTLTVEGKPIPEQSLYMVSVTVYTPAEVRV